MSQKPFTLPPGIIMIRDSYPDGAVYEFEDQTIGTLGRLIMTGVSQPRLTFRTEIAGDPDDPATATKWNMIAPLVTHVREVIEAGRANGSF